MLQNVARKCQQKPEDEEGCLSGMEVVELRSQVQQLNKNMEGMVEVIFRKRTPMKAGASGKGDDASESIVETPQTDSLDEAENPDPYQDPISARSQLKSPPATEICAEPDSPPPRDPCRASSPDTCVFPPCSGSFCESDWELSGGECPPYSAKYRALIEQLRNGILPENLGMEIDDSPPNPNATIPEATKRVPYKPYAGRQKRELKLHLGGNLSGRNPCGELSLVDFSRGQVVKGGISKQAANSECGVSDKEVEQGGLNVEQQETGHEMQ